MNCFWWSNYHVACTIICRNNWSTGHLITGLFNKISWFLTRYNTIFRSRMWYMVNLSDTVFCIINPTSGIWYLCWTTPPCVNVRVIQNISSPVFGAFSKAEITASVKITTSIRVITNVTRFWKICKWAEYVDVVLKEMKLKATTKSDLERLLLDVFMDIRLEFVPISTLDILTFVAPSRVMQNIQSDYDGTILSGDKTLIPI